MFYLVCLIGFESMCKTGKVRFEEKDNSIKKKSEKVSVLQCLFTGYPSVSSLCAMPYAKLGYRQEIGVYFFSL